MPKLLRFLLIFLAVLLIIYLLGPAPKAFDIAAPLPANPYAGLPPTAAAAKLQASEAQQPTKPGNEAQVVFADSAQGRTPYVVLYLPGFTATHEEGNPVHRRLARTFGCNLMLARLAEHGLQGNDPLLNLSAERYWQSAVEALRLAEQLGDSVILISTSTGGTLANMLCAQRATKSRIAANLLYSPNIKIKDPAAPLLNNHWGLQVARMVKKGDYILSQDQRPEFKKYWYSKFRIEGAVAVQELIETSMNRDTYAQITTPTLLLYYYKSEEAQDDVVRVDAMQEMFGQLATPAALKVQKAIPSAGDHVLANPLKSKGVEEVHRASEIFLRQQKMLSAKPM